MSKLDGAAEEVGFYFYAPQGGDESSPAPWQHRLLKPFFGSQDYFEFYVVLMPDGHPSPVSFEGVFWVRTERGTTYWLHSADESHFIWDRDLHQSLIAMSNLPYERGMRVFHTREAREGAHAQTLQNRLNPGTCR